MVHVQEVMVSVEMDAFLCRELVKLCALDIVGQLEQAEEGEYMLPTEEFYTSLQEFTGAKDIYTVERELRNRRIDKGEPLTDKEVDEIIFAHNGTVYV